MIISHKPLENRTIKNRMFELMASVNDDHTNIDSWDSSNYTNDLIDWMQKHPKNSITGWEEFPNRAYSAGSIDAITGFIYRYGTFHRLRFSRAEFVGAKIASQAANLNWKFLEDDDVQTGDALLLSMPFSGTGNVHDQFDSIMDTCDELNVPVFLDLSYWPISYNINLDLSRKCIQEVVFSLSKPIATQLRLGMRMTRTPVDDMLQVNSDLKIYNRIAVWTGMQLMREFSIDYLLSTYLPKQLEVCQNLELTPSNTFTLASGDENKYSAFNRNGYNRICITDEIT